MESELYSFDIVAWEVLTGEVPWEGFWETRPLKAVVIKEERPPLGPDVAATPLSRFHCGILYGSWSVCDAMSLWYTLW